MTLAPQRLLGRADNEPHSNTRAPAPNTDKRYQTEEIVISVPIALSPDEAALVEHARRIAKAANEGQLDKAHLSYFESHVADVYRRVASYGGGVNEQIAALLHDVLEDSEVSESELRIKGVPEAALVIVKLLTKIDGEPKTECYERIRQHEPSRRVKLLGDIASNTDPDRLALLPEEMRMRLTKRYAEATSILANPTSHN